MDSSAEIGEQDDTGLSLAEFTSWMYECEEQPAWRARADREMDYCDGNQLDSEVLRKMQEIGMPPAIEPLIGPTIDAVLGAEAKSRTDWRVVPGGDKSGQDVADALNFKLNQAERHSKADTACSDAYASQIKAGIGWVEVARESDPFKFPFRCEAIHRNEIWWDFLSKPDMSNARFLIRRKWMPRKHAALMHPEQAGLIDQAGSGWFGIDPGTFGMDGGTSTDLSMSWEMERGWSVEEQQWRDTNNSRVCLYEVWYRVFERVTVLKAPDGRVVEYDSDNAAHVEAVSSGFIEPVSAVIGKVRLAWFMGPHKLSDGPSPYPHNKFPYVPFWGKREDRTGVPFGLIRGMMFLQDEVNARIAKMQWGLASVRTTRTEGAVIDDDDTFRQEVARPDADIVLDPEAMQQGGVFKVERDFELNRQQYDRLVDAREGIKRTGGIYNAFMGQDSNAIAGVAISGLVEQSNQTLADINDNFNTGRSEVGDLLLSLVVEDMTGKEVEVEIAGEGLREDRVIRLNVKTRDEETGIEYLTNDIERTKLKVTLSDVASTPSFRAQQLSVMGEAFKSAPPDYQKVMMPHLFSLMDVPNKEEMIKAIQALGDDTSPEAIQKRIDDAVQQALTKAQMEIKLKELEQKQPLIDAQVQKTIAEAVSKGIEGFFSATNTAGQIALQPQIAPAADAMLLSAGFQDKNRPPIIPSVVAPGPVVMPDENTSPMFPPRIPSPAVGNDAGIESGVKNAGF